MRPKSVGLDEDAGFGAVSLPGTTGPRRRPTPIPAVNVTINARPTTEPASAIRPPRPAAGNLGAWEGPGVREVMPGGSSVVVGWVGIRSVSIGGIGLVRS